VAAAGDEDKPGPAKPKAATPPPSPKKAAPGPDKPKDEPEDDDGRIDLR
jgi:hypothetical protein